MTAIRRTKHPPLTLLVLGALGLLLLLPGCGGDGADRALVTPPAESGAVVAPDFPGGHTWFNVPAPLTIAGLEGKAVLLDFWTLGCINCQHIIPDLKRLEEEFGDALVVVGVHSGKYDREHSDQSVRDAIRKYGLAHPVVNDPDFAIWNTYGARAWPTLVLIDPARNIVGYHQGEGIYPVLQPAIANTIEEFDAKGLVDRTPIPLDLESEGARSAVLSFPSAVLADEERGRLFIADAGNNRILVSSLEGELKYAIGSGEEGNTDGTFGEATFRQPQGLAVTPDGNTLYVSDTRNHTIRAVDLQAQTVATIAGTGGQAGATVPNEPAPALETSLASPWGLLLHGNRLLIAMAGTHQIWDLNLATNAVQVFAGNRREGIDDGPRLLATLAQPSGLASDGEYLYWVDAESSSVRRVSLEGDGAVETLVGTGLFDFGDVDGPAGSSLLEHPQGIAYAGGRIYVSDTYNHKIRILDLASGVVSTTAGNGAGGAIDGLAGAGQLNEPGGVAATSSRLYVADTNNNALRTVDPATGELQTLSFSNLAVAVRGVEGGRSLRDALDAQTIGLSAQTFELEISAPHGYHLNDLAPSRLLLSTSNQPSLSLPEDTIQFSTRDESVAVSVPVSVGAGDAVLSLRGEVYYCRDGEEAVCLIDAVDIAIPVTVASAGADAIVASYSLPPAPF